MMEMDSVMAERPANIQAVCRLCLSEKTDSLKSIFDDALGPNRVPQKIQQLIQIQVNKNDKLTTMVCNDCIIRLDTWFSYKKQCHRNQAKLAEWMTKLVGQNILDVNLHIKSEPLDIDTPRHGVPIKVEVDYPLYTEVGDDEFDDFSSTQPPPYPRDNNDHLYLEHLPMEVDDADDSVHGARCPICHKTFQNINNRRRHQNMAHRKDKRAQMAEIKKPEVEPTATQNQPPPDQTAEQESVQQSSNAEPENNIAEKPDDDVGTTIRETTINPVRDNASPSMDIEATDSNKMTEKDEKSSAVINNSSAEANDSTTQANDSTAQANDSTAQANDSTAEANDNTAEAKEPLAKTNDLTIEMMDADADKPSTNEPNDSQHESIVEENKENPAKENIKDNSKQNIEVSMDGQENKDQINDKNEPSDEIQTAEKTIEENQDEPPTMPVEDSDNQQKIEFAAGLKLVQKDSIPPIEFESLSKIELSYIEKCKAMVSMFHTLQCACHNVQHKSLRYLLSHLREMRIWFPLFTCYSCMISFTDRSTFTRHHSKCPRGQLETLIKLSNIKKRSEIKPRLYQNYKCNRCKFLYSFHDDFCKHINEDHAAGSPPFYCSCRFVFDNLEEYKTHCYTSCVLSYYCDICFITTKTVEEFVKHCEETHDQSEGFVLLQEDSFTPRVNYTYRAKEANDESNVIEGKRERRKSAKETIMVQIYDSEIPPDPKDIPTRVLRKIVPLEHIPTNTADWNKQPAKCPACDKEYSSVSNMIRHYRIHIERKEVEIPAQLKSLNDDSDSEDLYSCPECGGVYPPSSWKNHIEENHPPVNCSECDKVFQFKSELNQHRSVHLNLKVYRDSKTHSYKTAAISPSAEENEMVGEIMVMCEICDAMFKNKEDLKHHKLTEHHSNISRASSSMESLEMSREDSKSGSKSVVKVQNPDDDIVDHAGNISFPCENCDRVYASPKTLKDHMMNRHGVEYLKKSEYPKKCDYCDRVCSTPAGFALHTQVHERVNPNPDKKSDFPKKCEYCDKICTTGAGLYLHTQMHERMTLGDLKKDKIIKKIVHDNPEEESYHTCKRCFKVFATKGRLKDHMKSHGINPSKGGSKLAIKKNRKILCDLCHIAVDSNDAMAKHKAEEHHEELDGMPTLRNEMEVDDAKPPVIYTCDICVETFDTKAELRQHKETHMVPRTKSALIYCKYCKIAFDSVNELTKHMHGEHGESAKPKITKEKLVDSGKPFKCPTCSKGFSTHGAMTAHAGWHKRSSNALQAEQRQQSPQESSAGKLVKKAKLLKKVTEAAVKKEEPIEPPPFQCTTCFLELPNETALQIHILEKHRHLDSLMLIPRCDTCNQDFMTQEEYDMHKRFHDLLARQKKHEQMQSQQKIQTPIIQSVHSVSEPTQNSTKKFPCNWCSSMFGRSDTLNTHVKQHHPEHVRTEFECPQCDRTFDKQSSLTIHLKVHDRQKNTVAVGNGVGGSGKIYSCSICSQCFNFPKDLRMHTINAHPF